MPQKGFTATRWTIDNDRITIYPYRIFFIISLVLAVIFGGLLVSYKIVERGNASATGLIALLLGGIVFIFLTVSNIQITFDRPTGIMQQKLWGLIPVRSIPFGRLYGVNRVTLVGGGFNFRIFPMNNKYGKGIIISSSYAKETNANAIAFSQEVIPLIHEYIAQYAPLTAHATSPITTYRYFSEKAGVYTLKTPQIATVITGIALVILGIHECIATPQWIHTDDTTGKILVLSFCFGLGLLFLLGAFTRVVFNPSTRTIERISPIGIGNRKYSFNDFSGFRTVRKSYNMIYAGTELQMYFTLSGAKQPAVMMVHTIRQSRKIEHYIEEIQSIMEK